MSTDVACLREGMEGFSFQSEFHCVYCRNNDIVVDPSFGDAICRECGLVVCERMPSDEAEWREYEDGEHGHRARASRPGEVQDDGTLHFTGGTKRDREFYTQVQRRSSTKSEQKMVASKCDVGEIGFKLGLGSHIKDIAKDLLESAHEKGVARQGGGNTLVASSIYVACQRAGFPRSLKEISDVSGIPMKKIARMANSILAEDEDNAGTSSSDATLGEEVCEHYSKRQKQADPNEATVLQKNVSALHIDLISRIGSQLSLENHQVSVCRQVCEKVVGNSLISSSAQGIAAAIIVTAILISGQKLDLSNVARFSSCSRSKIEKSFSQLRPFVKSVFPKQYVLDKEAEFNSLPLKLQDFSES